MSARWLGIDTGGTFTDFVEEVDGELRVHKVPSTPDNPADAVIRGLEDLVHADAELAIVHGSTVATNALLERRGASVGLVVTEGFEDILRIGRQNRRDIYAIDVERVEPLVPPERCVGARERRGADGGVVEALDDEEVERLVAEVGRLEVEAVAICFLHSYADPSHEERLAEELRADTDLFVAPSHEVLAEFREYERCSTIVINAYVGPVMSRYLDDLGRRSGAARLRIMQSNGGAMSVDVAREQSVHTILSGPAGGVVGGFAVGQEAGHDRLITFDMGGTSTDVSLCPGELSTTGESTIGELPIRVPVLDIHTVGAGGGSIASFDRGGALRVGPRSAGADPGPVCYGRGGGDVTVTDANLVLGRLSADHFLGGEAELDVDGARESVEALAATREMDPIEVAEGIIRVANTTMEGAIRVISVERGHDPGDFTLVCFGGAGAMHAATLAKALGMPRVLVPEAPGTLSALGMLRAEPARHYSRTLLIPGGEAERQQIEDVFRELEDRARRDDLLGEAEDLELERTIDMRYRGQGFELSIPFGDDLLSRFHDAHERRYGYADRERPTEIVTLRLRARVPAARRRRQPADEGSPDPSEAELGRQPMTFEGEELDGTLLHRDRLRAGHAFTGPALVVEYSSTTVVPPGWSCEVDGYGNLILTPGESGR